MPRKQKSLASRLIQKIEILEITTQSDGQGGWVELESVYASTWAEQLADTQRSVERLVSTRIEARLTHLMRIRAIAGLQHTMRVRWTPRWAANGTPQQRTAHVRGITDFGEEMILALEEQVQ